MPDVAEAPSTSVLFEALTTLDGHIQNAKAEGPETKGVNAMRAKLLAAQLLQKHGQPGMTNHADIVAAKVALGEDGEHQLRGETQQAKARIAEARTNYAEAVLNVLLGSMES